MKKRRRNSTMAPSPPSAKEMMTWSAEGMADSAMRNHPKMKQARDEITQAVMGAAEHALSKALKGPAKGKKAS